jgi:hypothetical protein
MIQNHWSWALFYISGWLLSLMPHQWLCCFNIKAHAQCESQTQRLNLALQTLDLHRYCFYHPLLWRSIHTFRAASDRFIDTNSWVQGCHVSRHLSDGVANILKLELSLLATIPGKRNIDLGSRGRMRGSRPPFPNPSPKGQAGKLAYPFTLNGVHFHIFPFYFNFCIWLI